jgi:NhaA family Na+:H+ antiporter
MQKEKKSLLDNSEERCDAFVRRQAGGGKRRAEQAILMKRMAAMQPGGSKQMKIAGARQSTSILALFLAFFRSDYASGSLLLLATLGAILLANGPVSAQYQQLLRSTWTVGVRPVEMTETVGEWLKAALMAVFFLAIGLEIKQELVMGSLSSGRKAALPVAGALGGMLTPALIFAFINRDRASVTGWAIPMATDPAFAIAILSVLRNRIPAGVRAFLVTLAVVDDIGATLVIALVYHAGLSLLPILVSLVIVTVLLVLNEAGVQSLFPYLLLGMFLWLAFIESGIHTSVGGMLLALTIPVRAPDQEQPSPGIRLENALLPWVNFCILPLFALLNAGIVFQELSRSTIFLEPIVIGVALGLLIGKPFGILMACFTAVSLGVAHLPRGVGWRHLLGVGFLGGIGFTTSIFLASLAFQEGASFDYSKIGILVASGSAAVVGSLLLLIAPRAGEMSLRE